MKDKHTINLILIPSIRSISGVAFSLDYPEAIFSEHFFVLSFQFRSPQYYPGASFKCSLINSTSSRSLVSSSLKYLCSFIILTGDSFSFFIVFNSYGSAFKIHLPLLSYQFICSSQKSYRRFVQDLPKFVLSLFNHFQWE